MARGGITLSEVERARRALLARQVNPSIDAIRVELGNTGSKSTIQKFLREIEEDLDFNGAVGQEKISDTLQASVAGLSAQIQREAADRIETAQKEFDEQLFNLKNKVVVYKAAIAKHERTLEEKGIALAGALEKIQEQEEERREMSAKARESEIIISEAEKSIASLQEQLQAFEKRHEHERESLVHYRESVKEQREQDARAHEQQIQAAQAEIRQLKETISLKLTEISSLSNDNARMTVELSAGRKALDLAESQLKEMKASNEKVVKAARGAESNLTEMRALWDGAQENQVRLEKELSDAKKRRERDKKEKGSLAEEALELKEKALRLEVELDVKSEMLEKLMKAKPEK